MLGGREGVFWWRVRAVRGAGLRQTGGFCEY